MQINLKGLLSNKFNEVGVGWDIRGIIDSSKRIYTISDDTKLISKVFELVSFPIIVEALGGLDLAIEFSEEQTIYPDITVVLPGDFPNKIAIDIKSSYRRQHRRDVSATATFTLGSYTAYLCNNSKNIKYPYDQYQKHWVVGFIYDRLLERVKPGIVPLSGIDGIVPPIHNIELIVQEKWRIASDKPGSGNTANIGSISDLDALRKGEGIFTQFQVGEKVFEDYWRRKGNARNRRQAQPYTNIREYIDWLITMGLATPGLITER